VTSVASSSARHGRFIASVSLVLFFDCKFISPPDRHEVSHRLGTDWLCWIVLPVFDVWAFAISKSMII
jgi:hypothetical protein